jgi:PAS domain S-box-containing protein
MISEADFLFHSSFESDSTNVDEIHDLYQQKLVTPGERERWLIQEIQGFQFLLALSQRLSASSRIDEIGRYILRFLIPYLHVDLGEIRVIQSMGGTRQAETLVYEMADSLKSTGRETTIAQFQAALTQEPPEQQDLIWRVVAKQAPLLIDAEALSSATNATWQNLGVGQLSIFPVPATDGSVIGVLTFAAFGATPLPNPVQRELVTAACCILGTVLERKQAEERLRLLESVLVHASDAVIITEAKPLSHPGPRILYVNEAFTRHTGYSLEEAIGKTPRILQGEKTDRATLDRIRAALENWQPIMVELINYHKDGTEFWIELSLAPVADPAGCYSHWIAIQRDITQRKQLEAELRKMLAKEKELSDLKSRFVSMTSHEFRTPLSTILSASELLEYYSRNWSEEEKLEQLHLIQSSVQHMTQLLEDVLIIGKAEAGQLHAKPTWIDLNNFCVSLVTEMQLSVGSQHLLVFQCPPGSLNTYSDEKLLRQILTNLLSNAIKYSTPRSTVSCKLLADSNTVILQVQDSGIGIPPEDLPHLFDSFHRAKNVGTIPGTGLGLAIVKRCVDLLGGQIAVNSELGVGTTFTVQLPLMCPDVASP